MVAIFDIQPDQNFVLWHPVDAQLAIYWNTP